MLKSTKPLLKFLLVGLYLVFSSASCSLYKDIKKEVKQQRRAEAQKQNPNKNGNAQEKPKTQNSPAPLPNPSNNSNKNNANAEGMYMSVVYPNVKMEQNIGYGEEVNIYGKNETLLLDAYLPDGGNLPSDAKQAAVIFVHGGSFQSGSKQQPEIMRFCKEVAKRGYVGFSIDYRLGIEGEKDATDVTEAAFRAQQDLRTAIKYIKANAAKYRVNPNKIVIVGSSAGGITCLLTAFMDADEVPVSVNQKKWGSVEGRSTNNASSEVLAVVNMWGAILDPSWIDANDPPVFLVHSTNDHSVPYMKKEKPKGFVLYGSYFVNEKAKEKGVRTDMITYTYEGHGEGLEDPLFDKTLGGVLAFLYDLVK